MFLVGGLPRDAEGCGDIGPGPAAAEGVFDRRILDLIREFPKGDDGRKLVGDRRERV
jgi:hypothetical protein